MIWSGPGITPGSSTDALVHLADILPTLMVALGTGDRSRLDGESLLALIL